MKVLQNYKAQMHMNKSCQQMMLKNILLGYYIYKKGNTLGLSIIGFVYA